MQKTRFPDKMFLMKGWSLLIRRINLMVDMCKENKRRWPYWLTGTIPTSVNVRIGNSRDFRIKGKSMNEEDVDLSQRMKDMVEYNGW